jgi:DNA invertase Pin-like site-specific DNA recombinase
MRVALYTRISTRDKGQDTANQLGQLREFCKAQGWEIVQEYEDQESGANAERRQFRAMMNAAAHRRFDTVLFWALDRFTREGALATLQYLNQLSSYGVGFRSFTEPYLDSCGIFKDAVIAILGTVAQQERRRISERVRAGLDRASQRGTRSGNPIGRPRVILRRDHVAELRRQGLSWSQIASSTGASTGTVRRCLLNCADASAPCQNPPTEAA